MRTTFFATTSVESPCLPSSQRTRDSRVRKQRLAAGALQAEVVLVRPRRAVFCPTAVRAPDLQSPGDCLQLPHLSWTVGRPSPASHGPGHLDGPILDRPWDRRCLRTAPAMMACGGFSASVTLFEWQCLMLAAPPACGADDPARLPVTGRGRRRGHSSRWCRRRWTVFLRSASAPPTRTGSHPLEEGALPVHGPSTTR